MIERTGLIVWVNDSKAARNLEKYGSLHYISKKMNYVVLYVNAAQSDEISRNMARLPYVKKVERSMRNDIKTEYSSNVPDKTRFYSM
jgi:uncharacterized protein YlbG (UPF0298 family)